MARRSTQSPLGVLAVIQSSMRIYLNSIRDLVSYDFQLMRISNGRWVSLSVAEVAKIMVSLQSFISTYPAGDPDISEYVRLFDKLRSFERPPSSEGN